MADSKKIYPISIAIPFRIDEFGKVATTSSLPKLYADRVRSVIGTALGERVFRPEFGTSIPSGVFDTVEVIEDLIDSEIRAAFSRHLPVLTFLNVVINFDDKDNVISVEVEYALPDGKEVSTVVGIANLFGDNILDEELL